MGKKNLIFPTNHFITSPLFPIHSTFVFNKNMKEKRWERENVSLPSEGPHDKTTDKHQ